MTWQAVFKSIRDEDLIANIQAIIARDYKAALDVLYPSLSLVDFAEKSLGQVRGLEFPCLAIAPKSNASSPSEDRGRLIQGFRVDIYIGVIDDGPDTVTNRTMRYMTTLGEVLRAATKADMFVGATGQVFGFVLETEWEYGPIGSNNNVLFRSAQMTATITVNSSN